MNLRLDKDSLRFRLTLGEFDRLKTLVAQGGAATHSLVETVVFPRVGSAEGTKRQLILTVDNDQDAKIRDSADATELRISTGDFEALASRLESKDPSFEWSFERPGLEPLVVVLEVDLFSLRKKKS